MSVSIHNGFKIKALSLDEVADIASAMRSKASSVARSVIASKILLRAIRIIDQHALSQPASPAIPSLSRDIRQLHSSVRACRQTLSDLKQSRTDARIDFPARLALLDSTLEELDSVLPSHSDIPPSFDVRSSPLRQAISSVSEEILESIRSRHRLPSLDVNAEIWVFREQNADCFHYYGILKADNPNLYSALSSSHYLEPMPYWSGNCPPDGIALEDWSARGELWSRIIGKTGIPADKCTTFSLCGEYGLDLFSLNGNLSEEAILAHLSGVSLACDNRAEYWARRQWSNKRLRVLSENTDREISTSLIFQIMDEANKADVSEEKAQILGVLPKITALDLTRFR